MRRDVRRAQVKVCAAASVADLQNKYGERMQHQQQTRLQAATSAAGAKFQSVTFLSFHTYYTSSFSNLHSDRDYGICTTMRLQVSCQTRVHEVHKSVCSSIAFSNTRYAMLACTWEVHIAACAVPLVMNMLLPLPAGIPGHVEFVEGQGGLPTVLLKHSCGASAQVHQQQTAEHIFLQQNSSRTS